MTLYPFRWKLGDEVRLPEPDPKRPNLPLHGRVVALELRDNGTWASVQWPEPHGGYRRTAHLETSLRARHG